MIFLILLLTSLASIEHINCLTQCYLCDESTNCGSEKIDYCGGEQDTCYMMKFVNLNGQNVTSAGCKTWNECGTQIGTRKLCFLRFKCEVNMCCMTDNCNYSDAKWIKLDKRLYTLVALVIAYILRN
ncbi:uncharacterized protein LOC101241262 isoform X1 [Hydra vulgaris]|uniref:uncharacterized protein LOC101241262 isoform X1 n=1 Tax=Hydra vulgaris TaxID=6087 RepID=UPI0006415FE8|nr:uncharacterized protein LOC101241262 [Hydra vulgaris]